MNQDFIDQAIAFDRFAETSYPWKFIEMPALNEILFAKVGNSTKCLDLGSGGGRVVRFLEKLGVAPENITGIDLSPELIKLAGQRSPEAKFLLGDITHSEIYNKVESDVDLVTSVHVFEHLDLEEMRHCLTNTHIKMKAGGTFVCLVGHPFRYSSEGAYNKNYWYEQITPWGKKVSHYHKTVSDYINSFLQAGYMPIQVIEPGVVEQGREEAETFNNYNSKSSRLVIVCKK